MEWYSPQLTTIRNSDANLEIAVDSTPELTVSKLLIALTCKNIISA
jgi:hypothetical protein